MSKGRVEVSNFEQRHVASQVVGYIVGSSASNKVSVGLGVHPTLLDYLVLVVKVADIGVCSVKNPEHHSRPRHVVVLGHGVDTIFNPGTGTQNGGASLKEHQTAV